MYDHWETTFDLIREIMVYKTANVLDGELIDKLEDTGSLRGDLLQLLTLYQSVYTGVGPEIMNAVLYELGQNTDKVLEIEANAKTKNILVMRKLLGYARIRGDETREVSDEMLTLPFGLIRIST